MEAVNLTHDLVDCLCSRWFVHVHYV